MIPPSRLRWAVIAVIAAVVIGFGGALALGAVIGRGCSTAPVILENGIDAGPGERAIAAELDGAVRREQAHIDALIAANQRELSELRDADAAEFDRRKRDGRAALAEWFASRMPDGGAR